jgi:cytochrome d ubiquinol oxidase subunit II
MEAVWYALIAFMLIAYVVLDGFDLGAGMVHLWVARDDAERRTVLAAIGPVWDGNEVWLIAAGGVLVFAFPRAYAAAFSGFYLPLMMALWLLVGRGLSIELRPQEPSSLWRAFWDAAFACSSALLALVLGLALGNLVRGVPLDGGGYFAAPLFTNLAVGPGIIDWYTLLVGSFALCTLATHGALYLAWKCDGTVGERTSRLVVPLGVGALMFGVGTTVATAFVQPSMLRQALARPAAWPWVLLALAGPVLVAIARRRRAELYAFVGSCAFIAGLLALMAVTLYPNILRSTVAESFSITAHNAASGRAGLRAGLYWWVPSIAIAVGYFVYLFRSFRGKVRPAGEH